MKKEGRLQRAMRELEEKKDQFTRNATVGDMCEALGALRTGSSGEQIGQDVLIFNQSTNDYVQSMIIHPCTEWQDGRVNPITDLIHGYDGVAAMVSPADGMIYFCIYEPNEEASEEEPVPFITKHFEPYDLLNEKVKPFARCCEGQILKGQVGKQAQLARVVNEYSDATSGNSVSFNAETNETEYSIFDDKSSIEK